MAPNRRKSFERKKYEVSSDKRELKHAAPKDEMEDVLMRSRIRDFSCLISSYPIKGGRGLPEKIMTSDFLRHRPGGFHAGSAIRGGLYGRTLGYQSMTPEHVEGLIPEDIIRDIKYGLSSIFDVEAARSEKQNQQSTDSTTTMEEKQVLELKEVVNVIPGSVLNLAADLAVEQLIQTFQIQDVLNVWFITRDEVEKQAVMVKIEAALNEVIQISKQDKGSGSSVSNKRFHGVKWVDASKYHTSAEVELAQEITKQLELEKSHAASLKQKMKSIEYLVIVVDGSNEKMLDLQHVLFHLAIKREGGVVVFLTTESAKQKNEESRMSMDLDIQTRDHLLPWVLFCRTVGCDLIRSSSAIQDIAAQIVEECRGHLLAIVLVGKSLKNKKDIQLWKLALDKLCTPSYLNDRVPGTVSKPVMVNAFVNIIWEDLNSIQKQCLEYCSFNMEVRIQRTISEWVSNRIVDTPEEADHILQELVDHSILLKSEQGGRLRLPKEIKDILQSLLGLNRTTDIKQRGLGLTKMPCTWQWKTAKRIELMNNKISQLTPSPHCPELEILLLQGNTGLMEIPPSFFDRMPKLRILDVSFTSIRNLPINIWRLHKLKELYLRGCEFLMELPHQYGQLMNLERLDVGTPNMNLPRSPSWPELRELYLQHNVNLTEIPSSFFDEMNALSILDLSYTSISDLPDSLFYLKKLKELYLRGCELLMELPPKINQLDTLEKLDLAETQITHLPREIQELTNLQSLTVCFYGYDQSIDPIIPGGVLSKLAQLSYLSIDVNPDDKRWDENVEVILPEIAGLRRLKTLVLYIPRVKLLKYMPVSKYFNFQLVVGDHKKRIISREPPTVTAKLNESERTLRFVYGPGVPDEINEILGRTEAFFLDRHTSIKSLSEFEVQNIWTLSVCIVAECNEMEMLVDGCLPQKNILFFVEYLSVYFMKNLESIWRGPAPSPSSFRRLKYLALQTCPKLTTIFTLDFLNNLSMLEELIVEDCPKVSTLISRESSEANEKHFLSNLRKLLLVYLPEMGSISNGLHIGENLEIICFYYCPKLKHLSPKELSSKELKVIKGETKWWEELKWNRAEWGKAGRPNKINNIFSPINEEADVMSQLTAEMTNF